MDGINFNLHTRDLFRIFVELKHLHREYASHFHSKTRSVATQAVQYLQGKFLEKGRGNMTRYARNVPDSNNQSMQNCISESPWNERLVIAHIQRDVTDLIGDPVNGSIHIDESGFPKQGTESVGVKRQYCGRLGKVENCQVGVFLGYVNETYRTLIDERLYLPEDWAEDQDRREKCGVPEDVVFKTKAELGLEMIRSARDDGVPFGWVGMDSFYGEQPWLLNEIDSEEMTYIADIPVNTRVWLNKPKTGVPARKGDRGRIPTKERVLEGEPDPIEVRKLKDQLDAEQWNHIFIRDTERKKLWSNIACIRVYPVVDELPGDEIWLIIRQDDGERYIKYQFSNTPPDTSVERCAQMSCSRYWIERAFEDGKGIAGLADYQVRNWTGWHHHITISLLAMLVLLILVMNMGKKAELLTVQDMKEILEVILPKKEITEREILKIIEEKHRARYSARMSHHRRNG
jgi:SRSO17 transposase